jgi:phage terminase large subunit-like protein
MLTGISMADIRQQQLVASAVNRMRQLQLAECFDPSDVTSRPTAAQQTILDDIGLIKFRWVVAGNQCLAEGTLVATPHGPIPIEELRIDDLVYNEHGSPIRVLQVFNNGPREVVTLTNRGMIQAKCTTNHTFLTRDGERTVDKFHRDSQIRRVELNTPLGSIHEPDMAYAIAALLGDGCSMAGGKQIYISSADSNIPNKLSNICGTTAVKCGGENYTWHIGRAEVKYYNEWCRDRYAHEKWVDINVVRGWDRDTLLAFVAGIIDTDGSIYMDSWNTLCISTEMQARTVLEVLQYAFLALWQTQLTIYTNDRDKFVNGPTYSIRCANNAYSKRILHELDPYLVTPSKKWKPEYSDLVATRTNPDWIGAKHNGSTELVNTYDIHVESSTNLYCLANGLVTHNSGKSGLAAREITWILTNTHPTWVRPAEWGTEPLLIIVAGQDRKMMDIELWGKKLAQFLDTSKWKERRVGGSLQSVENIDTGDTIVFLSHNDSSEKHRKHMQGYVAHYVWLDEMPSSIYVLEELQQRVAARNGYFLATFTPKFRNDEIRKIVDSASEPTGRKYSLSKLDNPLYAARIQEELDKLNGYTEEYRNTILYGAWSVGEDSVYELDPAIHVREPINYSPQWRHVESVDPALKSKFGYTLWAEDPATSIWYCIVAEYIEDILDPVRIVEEMRERTRHVNIIRRICDPHEAWYLGRAAAAGITPPYMSPYDKNSRKAELIMGLRSSLGVRLLISPKCTNLIGEFRSCRWAPNGESRIVNASSYHLLDTAQYFADLIPKADPNLKPVAWHEWLYLENERRKQRNQSIRNGNSRIGRGVRSRWNR